MTTRRGLFVAPFDQLADPRVVELASAGGRISGHNRRAQQMLIAEPGVETMGQSLLGMRFDELFDARAEDLGRFVY